MQGNSSGMVALTPFQSGCSYIYIYTCYCKPGLLSSFYVKLNKKINDFNLESARTSARLDPYLFSAWSWEDSRLLK